MYRKSVVTKTLESKRRRCASMRAAKDRKRAAESESMRDCGGIVTDGCLGSHTIRLLCWPDEPRRVAVVVDGHHRRPRTIRGVWKCLAAMLVPEARRQ